LYTKRLNYNLLSGVKNVLDEVEMLFQAHVFRQQVAAAENRPKPA
jgi:hypothetical protein